MNLNIKESEVQVLVDDPESYSAEASIDIVGSNAVMEHYLSISRGS